ncbi:MAG: phosphotransferase [Spirochaetales bacterium]|nr:phosphotransferase [Spirochaetales bacterium]
MNDRNEDGGGKDGLKTPAGTPIPNPGNGSPFDLLSPDIIFDAVQSAYDIKPDGRLSPCSSYVNRVYGLSSEAGDDYVVKFYRPGRWSEKAIREEQDFLADCQKAEIPVIAPVENSEGEGLSAFDLEPEEENGRKPLRFFFTLYPKRGGRNFDAEGDSDWLRLGRLAGRLHAAGSLRDAPSRVRLGPELALSNLEKIEASSTPSSEPNSSTSARTRSRPDTKPCLRPGYNESTATSTAAIFSNVRAKACCSSTSTTWRSGRRYRTFGSSCRAAPPNAAGSWDS